MVESLGRFSEEISESDWDEAFSLNEDFDLHFDQQLNDLEHLVQRKPRPKGTLPVPLIGDDLLSSQEIQSLFRSLAERA
jgi:hypothetical protein